MLATVLRPEVPNQPHQAKGKVHVRLAPSETSKDRVCFLTFWASNSCVLSLVYSPLLCCQRTQVSFTLLMSPPLCQSSCHLHLQEACDDTDWFYLTRLRDTLLPSTLRSFKWSAWSTLPSKGRDTGAETPVRIRLSGLSSSLTQAASRLALVLHLDRDSVHRVLDTLDE